MSRPSSTDNKANFRTTEEDQVMPATQQNAAFRVPSEPHKNVKIAPRNSNTVQRATQAAKATSTEAHNDSNQSAGTKANRNRINPSDQMRRKTESVLFNNR